MQKLIVGAVATVTLYSSDSDQQVMERKMGSLIRAFYSYIMKENANTLPSNTSIQIMKPLISAKLSRLLSRARDLQERHDEFLNNQSHPIISGAIFFSRTGGATRVTSVDREVSKNGVVCKVGLEYKDPIFGTIEYWYDKIYLVNINQEWFVDDIEYFGDYSNDNRGKLSEKLIQVEANYEAMHKHQK